MVSRRGQAAMEFLMTYGWAILVVLVVIGALAYFGVLNPTNLLPEKCQLPAPFECSDYAVTDSPGRVILFITNGESRVMEISKVNISSIGGESTPVNGCVFRASTARPAIRAGERQNVTITLDGLTPATPCVITDTGKKSKMAIDIVYNWKDNQAINRTISGELFAKVQHS